MAPVKSFRKMAAKQMRSKILPTPLETDQSDVSNPGNSGIGYIAGA